MTTIAYDYKNKQIAFDSRLSRGSGIISSDDYNKSTEINDCIFFISGKPCDKDLLIDYYFDTQKTDLIPECEAVVFDRKLNKVINIYVNENSHIERLELSFTESFGSGARFALAALDFGKTARESIEYAATRDFYTGGKVRVFDCKSGEFI